MKFRRSYVLFLSALLMGLNFSCASVGGQQGNRLPSQDEVMVDETRGEVLFQAVVQHPSGYPCIDDWGTRTQSFVGCRIASGRRATFADHFVFKANVGTEKVHDGLVALGAKPKVHYSVPDAKKRSGLKATTKPEDYLQGDPVVISIFWEKDGAWVERPYEDFILEKVSVGSKEVIKPWTPHFVFHGSGVIYNTGSGCLACPCDCAGGIIADNRYPIYDPKPVVRFNWDLAPEVGTTVYVRIRPVCSRAD